jgi:hypothetical protein
MLRKFVQGCALVGVVVGLGALGAGCLDRPVTAASPTIKTNFTSAVNQSGIDKVDILFDIDNSASMGDKQQYLIEAIPQMIARLVTPRCISTAKGDAGGQPLVDGTGNDINADPASGACPTGSAPEFTAVHDMHIGVVTSSLGGRLGPGLCDPTATAKTTGGATVSDFNDDKGELINRTGTTALPYGLAGPLADAVLSDTSGGFLYWFPTGAATNKGKSPVAPPAVALGTVGMTTSSTTLVGDFTEVVAGSGQSGCGIESQLESWYRFLIQPDPYESLDANDPVTKGAEWVGVDATIIQQRHDFLRNDSLVAIIVLSDENDSEIDVRAFRGSGYQFLSTSFTPPRATTECETNPLDPKCMSCPAGCTAGSTTPGCSDPNCLINGGIYNAAHDTNDWGYDLNTRHAHARQKYDLDPQFPLTRYSNGLTSATVPNRLGEYPSSTGGYVGTNNCTNPLFAKALPTGQSFTDADWTAGTGQLCNLPTGAIRTKADVFYAHIGGVPHQLLQSTPGDGTCPAGTAAADCPQKDTLVLADWQKILGQGTATYANAVSLGMPASVSYDYTGIDPHMIESETPRATLPGPAFGTSTDPVRPDPINGREWITNTGVHSLAVDREYACIFQLPAASQRDCADYEGNTVEGNSCDCIPGSDPDTSNPGWLSGGVPFAPGNPATEVPPLCSKTSSDGTKTSKVSDYTYQTHAKAYPTIRELTLADMMGNQGIVSSLCPIHTEDNAAGNDPLYGYRPAVNAIVNRLKSALGSQCVPELQEDAEGNVACLVLVSFPASSGYTTCGAVGSAYSTPAASVLSAFNSSQNDMAGDSGTGVNLSKELTCVLQEVPVPPGQPCITDSKGDQGWCYVTGAGITGGSTCSQQISYTDTGIVPNGATINLQCISTNQASDAGSTATGDATK